MATKILTEQEVLERIEEILKEPINKDLEFLGFVGGKWTNTRKTKLLIKCKKHNTINKVTFVSFSNRRSYMCEDCIKDLHHLNKSNSDDKILSNLKNKFNSCNLEFIVTNLNEGEIKGTSNRIIKVICPKHGEFTMLYKQLISTELGNPCKECNHEEYLARILENINNKIDLINSVEERDISFLGFVGGEYSNNNTKLILKCNIHNHIWETTPYSKFIEDRFVGGCEFCRREKSSRDKMRSPEDALKLVEDIHKDDTAHIKYNYKPLLDTYKGANKFVSVECPIHGYFNIRFSHLLTPNCGWCPECYRRSISERQAYDPDGEEIMNKIDDRLKDLHEK